MIRGRSSSAFAIPGKPQQDPKALPSGRAFLFPHDMRAAGHTPAYTDFIHCIRQGFLK